MERGGAPARRGDAMLPEGSFGGNAVARWLSATLSRADAQRRPDGWRPALALSAALLVYANGLALLAGPHQAEPNLLTATGNLLTVPLLLLGVSLAYRGRWHALGLGCGRLGKALGLGAAAGALMALPAVAVFAVPPLIGEPLRWQLASEMSAGDVAVRLLLYLTVGTALFEELLFRGVLWDIFVRARSTAVAWLATSTVFTLWHVVLTTQSVAQTNVPAHLAPLAVVLGLLGVFGGGLIFGALRLAGGLPAAMAAHWAVNALMLAALLGR